MKYFKIFLAILAVIAIGLAIYWGYSKTTKVDTVKLPENQFTRRINQEISDISNKPDSRFCRDAYEIVKYHIDDYASTNRLGADSTDISGNNQNQQFLYKTLYSAYADKFIAQSDYVFKGSSWSSGDLSFIKAEVSRLRTEGQKNGFLESGGPVDKDFNRINTTLSTYDKEIAFIYECRAFSYNNVDFERRFPVDKAQSIIIESKQHLSSLGVVKNSDAVKNGLAGIPDKVLSVHDSYLKRKYNEYKDMYMYYNSLNAYKTQFYDVLKSEMSQLDNNMYAGLNAASKKTILMNNLDGDYRAAVKYFQNK